MKVKELQKKLSNFNPELEVIFSEDPAGNQHRSAVDVDTIYGSPYQLRSGIAWDCINEDEIEAEDPEGNSYKKVVCIWP